VTGPTVTVTVAAVTAVIVTPATQVTIIVLVATLIANITVATATAVIVTLAAAHTAARTALLVEATAPEPIQLNPAAMPAVAHLASQHRNSKA
jgi:hypothetical protein